MTVSYKTLGVVNTKDMFKKAIKGGYAIPAYNFNNMEQIQGIVEACVESKSPVILQVSKGALKYATPSILPNMIKGAVEYSKALGKKLPIALHLDHGDSFETCKMCIDLGFSSVMIDGSHLPYEDNVKLTKKVCEYAHKQKDYVTVEGELGVLAGVEDDVVAETSSYTDPKQAADFIKRTGVDSLAISIGTSHGTNKFTKKQCTKVKGQYIAPTLKFDILKKIEKLVPNFPIVLHGASAVPQDLVKLLKKNGGKAKDAIGVAEKDLKKAAKMSICKINVDSDGRLAMTAAIRQNFKENPSNVDPRKYMGAAKEAVRVLYAEKNKKVFGSAGKA